MLGIIILACAFAVALIGIISDQASAPKATFFLGLTQRGVIIVSISIVCFIFGVIKEINTVIQAKKDSDEKEMLMTTIRETNVIVKGLANRDPDDSASVQLEELSNTLDNVASNLPNSQFSLSNFEYSDFSGSNLRFSNMQNTMFEGVLFEGSVFTNADFRGVDLSQVVVDQNTKLPDIQ